VTTLHPPRTRVPRRELVLPTLAVAVATLEPLRLRPRLPDPVLDAALMVVVTALVALLPLLAAARADRRAARLLVAIGHGSAAFFVLLRVATLERNLDAATWSDAGTLTFLDIGSMALLAAPVAAVGWWLGGRRPERARVVRAPAQFVLPADAAVAWVGRQRWPVGRVLGPSLVVAGAVIAGARITPDGTAIAAAAALAGLLVSGLTSIVVAVGPAGLRVRFGPLGWPSVRVGLSEMVGVTLEDVEPMAYGGWGYRVLPGVRAIVIRRGEGIRVSRIGRPDLVVTVDDAATAGAVLAAHLAGPGSAPGPREVTD